MSGSKGKTEVIQCILSLNPFEMVHHNQVKKEATVLLHYKTADSILLENPWGRMQRRMRHIQAVGHECASIICKAASHSRYLPLTCHTCFDFFIVFFPSNFQAKQRVLAVYWGHQDQRCLAALMESWSI